MQEDVHCYTIYDCEHYITFDSQVCFTFIPGDYRCLARYPENPALKCYTCAQDFDDPGEPYMSYSKKCLQ